jgi:hypothetical protein
MKERFKLLMRKSGVRKSLGIFFVIIGAISIITPFTPVGFLLIVGLEMLGIRFLFWDKLKAWFKKQTKDPAP